MTLDELDTFCQALPVCHVRYPFDSAPNLRAWCIRKRMFAWCVTNDAPLTVQVKADPNLIPALIDNYSCILPGYHMNKKHWITIQIAKCDQTMLEGLLEDAHSLIAASMPKAERLILSGDGRLD